MSTHAQLLLSKSNLDLQIYLLVPVVFPPFRVHGVQQRYPYGKTCFFSAKLIIAVDDVASLRVVLDGGSLILGGFCETRWICISR